jgi:hypothetical protein
MRNSSVSHSNNNKTNLERQRLRRSVALSRLKRKMLRKKWLLRTLILAGIVVVLCVFVSATFSFFRNSVGRYHFGVVRNFIFTPEGAIESIEDRTNVLILGKDGQGQEA